MLATSTDHLPQPAGDYTFEFKWDGVRALAYIEPGRFQLQSRNQLDITHRYPELHALPDAVGKHRVVLDGEIVSMDDVGRPSFAKLQHRMHLQHPAEITRLAAKEPVFFVVFDLLYLDGKSLLEQPYKRRRQLLEELTLLGPFWQVTPAHVGEGESMLDTARRNSLEGIVAKRLDSPYTPGRRSPAWLKLKVIQRQEFVIGGWVPERSGIDGRIGALLVGVYDAARKLHFVGKVGTGLDGDDHRTLFPLLKQNATATSPFAEKVPRPVQFVQPTLVAEVEYRRWPEEGGMIQHAAYKGLRTDKRAATVVKECNA